MIKRLLYMLDEASQITKLINKFGNSYIVEEYVPGILAGEKGSLVVITDREIALHDLPVIGVESSKRLSYRYVVEAIEDIEDQYLRLVYSRFYKKPLIIAQDDNYILKELILEDFYKVIALYDPAVKSYMKVLCDGDIDTFKAYIENMYGFYQYGMWGIYNKLDNSLIGLTGFDIGGELGYIIDSRYRNQGIGFWAASAAIDYGRYYGFEEIIIKAEDKNIPSIRLAKQLGFSFFNSYMDGNSKLCVYRLIL